MSDTIKAGNSDSMNVLITEEMLLRLFAQFQKMRFIPP
jgi:hypothetical protein